MEWIWFSLRSIEVFESNKTNNTFLNPQQITIVPNRSPVLDSGPTVSPGIAFAGFGSNFFASATDPDGDPVGLAWDFGDGTTGAGGITSHVYAAPGVYTVTVYAADGLGGLTSARVDVTVITLKTTAALTTKKLALNFKTGFDTFSINFNSLDFLFLKKPMLIAALSTNANYAVFVGDTMIDKGQLFNGKAVGRGKINWNIRTGDIKYSIKSLLQAALAAFGATNATTTTPLKLVIPSALIVPSSR